MNHALALILIFLLLVAAATPARAQYEDDATEDQRLQDERYYQRYLEEEEQADPEREPEPDEEALARAFLDKADQLIRDKNYRSRKDAGVRIQTDDPRLDLDAIERLFVAFHGFFDEFWDGRVELSPSNESSPIFLFYSYYKYNQLIQGDWRRSPLRPKGHYGNLFDAVVIHTDSDRNENLANTLIHEVAHRLVEQRIFGGGGASPWLSEGLATYFEYTAMDENGSFQPGVVGGKKIPLFSGSRSKGGSDAKLRLADLRRALRSSPEEGGLSVDDLLSTRDDAQFYSGNILQRYAASWMLVHYLLHGSDGIHADAFARYLRIEAEGGGAPSRFLGTIGRTASELDAALLDHLGSVKLR